MLSGWKNEVREQFLSKWKIFGEIHEDAIAFFKRAFQHTSCYDRAWFGIHHDRISLVVGGIFLAAIVNSAKDKGIWMLVDQDPPKIENLDYRPVKSTLHSNTPLVWAHTSSYDKLAQIVASNELWASYASASAKVLDVSSASADRDEVQKRRNKVRLSEIWPHDMPPSEKQSRSGRSDGISNCPLPFKLKPGCPSKLASTTAVFKQRKIDITLRHNKLQSALYKRLVAQYGEGNVDTEVPSGIGTSIDVVVRTNRGYIFYEIKTDLSPRICLREALGQLLEYSFWPGTQSAKLLVVVGESPLDNESKEFLDFLKSHFSLPIDYQQIILNY